MITWDKINFGKIQSTILGLERRLAEIQDNQIDILKQTEVQQIQKELEILLNYQEIKLAQKAWQLWLVNGDRNMKYFHTIIN